MTTTASPGRDIAQAGETEDVQSRRFRGDRVFGAERGFAPSDHQRTDAVRVAERQQAQAEHRSDHRIAAAHAAMHALHRFVRGCRRQLALLEQFMRQHVQQHFGIRLRVDVAVVLFVDFLAQRVGVGQVAVVRQRNAERRVGVERLRFIAARRAGGGVSAVRDAEPALQQLHLLRAEHVADQAVAFVQVDALPGNRGDAGGILATVLQDGQAVI